jgi:hypothetical protein
MNGQKITLLPMNRSNFDEAKIMMEQSFAASMDDLSDNSGPQHDPKDLPSIDGILEKPENTPLVFYQGETMVGGANVLINNDNNNELNLLFIDSNCLDRGIGYTAWLEIEKRYPQTKTWTTVTPPCLMRNIHFYVNKCGFHIIRVDEPKSDDPMFVFQKVMK